MRVGLAFILSGVVGFLFTFSVVTPMTRGHRPVASLASPPSWQAPPLRPPPLDLPPDGCSQSTLGEVPAEWSVQTAETHLASRVGEHDAIDLLDVDCDESPCIAWLRWRDDRSHPPLTYRWWSLDDAPTATMWTASHSFRSDDGMVQAVVATPARPSMVQAQRTRQRVQAGWARLQLP